MKAKDVLKITKIRRETLSRLVSKGIIKATRLENGHFDYDKESVFKYIGKKSKQMIVIYARVSTSKQKKDLQRQIENLESYCASKGLKIDKCLSEIASGINFKERKSFFELLDLIIDDQVSKVFITYKDRLGRVGYQLFSYLFSHFGTEIIPISENHSEKLDSEEIFSEIISLLHCFSMKYYSKGKVTKIKEVFSDE